MFPLFIGYWTLLVVNNREKNAKYYDPIGIEKNDRKIFNSLYSFIKQEINFHQNRKIENSLWKQLEYTKVNEKAPYDHTDSAVYILNLASKICTNKSTDLSPEVLNEYRTKLLVHLFKYGTKILY